MTHRIATGSAAVTAALTCVLLAGCQSSTTSSTGATSATSSSGTSSVGSTGSPSGSPVIETNPPGDIPDNQAYVPYVGTGFTVKIPEGWARTTGAASIVFSDKYNNITVGQQAAAQAPTIASASAQDVPAIRASSSGFVAGSVQTVTRAAGQAVMITYHAYSAPNPVTGKVANEAVERYVFWKSGVAVTLTLAAPVGSDNVDPWRKVTDSFAWTK